MARFHWFADTRFPASSTTLNSAVLGPDDPWFKAKKNNKTEIKMDELEQGTKEGTDLCKKYNIGGFPTILLLDNQGKPTMDSNGDVQNVEARSTDELLAFLNNSKM